MGNFRFSCSFSGKVWKNKSGGYSIPGFKGKFQISTSFAEHPSAVE